MRSGGGTRLEVALQVHGSNGKYLAVNLTSITVYMCTCVCWGRGAGGGEGRGGSTLPADNHSAPAELYIQEVR